MNVARGDLHHMTKNQRSNSIDSLFDRSATRSSRSQQLFPYYS